MATSRSQTYGNESLSIGVPLDTLPESIGEHFTTGDTVIDAALGGGIRTGMVWELLGERYSSLFYICVYIYQLELSQCIGEDPTGSAALASGADSSKSWWSERFGMLHNVSWVVTHDETGPTF